MNKKLKILLFVLTPFLFHACQQNNSDNKPDTPIVVSSSFDTVSINRVIDNLLLLTNNTDKYYKIEIYEEWYDFTVKAYWYFDFSFQPQFYSQETSGNDGGTNEYYFFSNNKISAVYSVSDDCDCDWILVTTKLLNNNDGMRGFAKTIMPIFADRQFTGNDTTVEYFTDNNIKEMFETKENLLRGYKQHIERVKNNFSLSKGVMEAKIEESDLERLSVWYRVDAVLYKHLVN